MMDSQNLHLALAHLLNCSDHYELDDIDVINHSPYYSECRSAQHVRKKVKSCHRKCRPFKQQNFEEVEIK